jgi:hypothetical protein
MKARAALAVFVSLVAMLPGGASGAEAVPCQSHALQVLGRGRRPPRDTIQIRTLHVDAKPLKPSYKVGAVAKVAVVVTRPAGEDPLGSGTSVPRPTSAPAEDVYVGIGVTVGGVFLPGFSVTDVQGKALVKIWIKSYAPAGKAQVSVYAYHTALDTACLRLEENGYQEYKNMFVVKPK